MNRFEAEHSPTPHTQLAAAYDVASDHIVGIDKTSLVKRTAVMDYLTELQIPSRVEQLLEAHVSDEHVREFADILQLKIKNQMSDPVYEQERSLIQAFGTRILTLERRVNEDPEITDAALQLRISNRLKKQLPVKSRSTRSAA